MKDVILTFLYFGDFSLYSNMWYIWAKFHGLLKRIYILNCLTEMFYRYLVGPFDLWCPLTLKFLYLVFFSLDILSIGETEILKSPTITCWCQSVVLHLIVFLL